MRDCRVLLVAVLALSMTAKAERIDAYANLFRGGWKLDSQFMDVMGSPYLLAHGIGHRVADAVGVVEVPRNGKWRVWVRTRDWVNNRLKVEGGRLNNGGLTSNSEIKQSNNLKSEDSSFVQPSTFNLQPTQPSAFKLSIGGKVLDKTFGLESGEWHWEDGGEVELTAGKAQIALKDLSGFDARCAGVVLTSDGEKPEGPLSVLTAPIAENITADLVVVGGGVPGTCAAIAAARSGLKVALIQDRPVLGGNASSEIRVWCAGELANDIVREVRGRFMNMEAEASIGDEWRQRVVDDETNIICRVSHRAFAAEKQGERISAVKALDLTRNRVVRFTAPLFIDATGDGWLGYWAGAEYRMGREAAGEFNETMAPEKADADTLGASLMWTSKRASNDEEFCAPWAEPWAQGQSYINGEWNWEYGIHRNVITEGEHVRDRLLLAIYGAFSNAKKDPKNCRMVLNFVPYLLGKRESRRLMGDWVLSEKDVTEKRQFEDAVSRGSWSVDLHYDTCKKGVDFLTVCKQPHYGRYYIPFRSHYSRNVPNLMMAGRCFSCTHVGLGGPRVINTLATAAVACGYAAAECKNRNILPRQVYELGLVRGIQRKLGGDWPGNPDPDKQGWLIVDDEGTNAVFGAGWSHAFNANGCTVNDKYAVAKSGEKTGVAEYALPVPRKGRYHLMRNVPFLPWNEIGGKMVIEIGNRLKVEGGNNRLKVEGGRLNNGGLTSNSEIKQSNNLKSENSSFVQPSTSNLQPLFLQPSTSIFSIQPLEHVGGWSEIGTFELEPNSVLRILPSRSSGTLYADAFAIVEEVENVEKKPQFPQTSIQWVK